MRFFAFLAIFFALCFGANSDEYERRGNYYYNNRDFFDAKDNYIIACNIKNANACYMLGHMYENGKGARQDYYIANEYYNKACDLGSKNACDIFLNIFINGCQNSNDWGSCYKVAEIYHQGIFAQIKNDKLALYYAKRACKLEYRRGCDLADEIEGNKRREQEAQEHQNTKTTSQDNHSASCKNGNAEACYKLGDFNDKGQDYKKALDNYRKSCELGYAKGCEKVLDNLRTGCNSRNAQDCILLAKYYEINALDDYMAQTILMGACDFGSKKACDELRNLQDRIRVKEKQKEERELAEARRQKELESEQIRKENERISRESEEEQRQIENDRRAREERKAQEKEKEKEQEKNTLIIIGIIVLFVVTCMIFANSHNESSGSSAEEIFGKKNKNENFSHKQNSSSQNSSSWDNANSNNQNFDDDLDDDLDDDEYKGYFTLHEAVYLVTILTKLMISDGKIDKQEVGVIGGFIKFVANDDDEAAALLEIHIKALAGNVNVYAMASSYKAKFNPSKTEIRYIIFLFLHMVYADGEFSADEKRLFAEIFQAFGIDHIEREVLYKIFWQIYGNEYSNRTRQDFGNEGDEDADEPDPYEVLGLSKDATFDEVKKRYRKLASQNHPDRFANASNEEIAAATKRMQEINTAYEKIKKKMGK
ncbi:DnaJ domain-containing protein [Campylobacter sp. VBCF_05 NA6]|uniref:DnaJ domain-containing protein n=1 Tax=unclassified Campylobacter TaxID=2593542 RepID=UPI0022E9A2DA|nr:MULTISPECIES: DnaJ domain-containing protein [unclassified Campylobacter]MDA3057947.1 DnaJ domain-containing protein [Campylobacter sp. VBCF_04 NA7]MDA3059276.1 DnaJ domain-containing protein [Campylobacter sp. VBCF_05 NA6]